MNWEAISAIGRLVGAIAVVISLIYLASAVRSNTRATREASMRWVSDNYTRWIQQISGHPDLSELYYRGIHDFESLKGAELVRFSDATDLIDLRFPRRRQDIKPALIEMLGLGDQWILIAERY